MAVILGLSHIALTVSEVDESVKYYQEAFGFDVLSDAERKGEWIDKITGIPGFHTRTVYLSVTPYQHLELFGFYHPEAIPAEKETAPRVGICYGILITGRLERLAGLTKTARDRPSPDVILDIGEEPYRECEVVTLLDPNGVILRVVEAGKEETDRQDSSERALLYPALIVDNTESSVRFYRDILGLRIASQGAPIPERDGVQPRKSEIPVRWVLLESPAGICLKLIQPLNTEILPARPWQMERIGFTHVAFAVKNLAGYQAELATRNVNFKSPPQSVTVGPHKGGKVVYLTTPEGIILELIDSPLTLEQASKI
ncbi:MAG: VOC family protein [Deltaproteobacteria bacterium]|nr:VOC family protein [Deltaproteobacteria bacterium]